MSLVFAELTQNAHYSVWRLVALTAIAISLWIYVVALIRAERREKKNPTPSQTSVATLWTVKFPELDHLPLADQERLLRGVLESSDVKTFEKRTRRLVAIIFYVTMAILLVVSVITNLPGWLITLSFTTWLLFSIATTIFIRVKLETRIVRHLLKQSLTLADKKAPSQS